jgi:hypothetical protein
LLIGRGRDEFENAISHDEAVSITGLIPQGRSGIIEQSKGQGSTGVELGEMATT